VLPNWQGVNQMFYTRLFPFLVVILMLCASAVYAFNGDIKRSVTFFAFALGNAAVAW
jgi:hypothetical protein